MLSVTDVGLSAIANAQAGGFLINLTTFTISENDISAMPEIDKIQAQDIQGAPIFSADVTSIEVVGTSAVRLKLTIPVNKPAAGTWSIRELGIYLDSGELFAYGPVEPAYDKSGEYAVNIYALVLANRLADVINVVVSQNNSLPSTPFVRSLVPPDHSYQNAILVLDEQTNEYQDASSASIAVKSGPGGSQWAFIGYNRVFIGTPDSITDMTSFVLSPDKGGFWLNDGEIVIGQVVSGIGDGYSRKMRFDKTLNSFTVIDKGWNTLATSSRIAIWRDVKNQLPSRLEDMEEYLVLGVGINDWKQTASAVDSTRYKAVFVSGTLDNMGYYTDSQFLNTTESTAFVFIDGKCIPYGGYALAGDKLRVVGSENKQFNIYIFVPETSAVGGTLAKFESLYDSDGVLTRFYLPIVPDNNGWVEAYLGDTYLPQDLWTFDDTSIVFAQPPGVGKLRTVCFATYEDDATSTAIKRYFYQASEGGTLTFPVDSDTFQKNRTVVYVNGDYFGEEDFTLTSDSLTITRAPTYVGGVAVIDITVFAVLDHNTNAVVSGTDTGPVWTDPAGRMGPPNKLVPKIISYASDGSRLDYPVYNVPRKANVILIAGGAHQDPRNMTYTRGSKNDPFGSISLSKEIPLGVQLDFICFTDVKDEGTATLCEVFNFTTTSSLSYTINPVADTDAVLIFIGGSYQHKGTFTVTGGTNLNLLSVVPGMKVEVWYFKSVPHAGWRTEMYVDFNTSSWVNSYPMTHSVAREENTLVFLDSVYQYKDKYKTVDANEIQQVVYDAEIEAQYQGFPLINVYFVSGDPLTRLLKREDSENLYMPRHGPYVDWPNLSYRLRDMLACPMTKLLALLTGTMEMDFNSGTSDDQDLAAKYGLRPVTKTLTMDVLPTASYASIGSGATLGAKMKFNVYKYLEIYLKQELGSATFTIHDYEQGVKYFIDDVQLGAMSYEAIARADIPMITWSTGIYISYPSALMGITYPGVPLLTNFFDMRWSRDNVSLPSGFSPSDTRLRTVSVDVTDDDSTQSRTFTHVIISDFTGQTYTVKWKRPYTVVDQNTEYLTRVSSGGAPGYVQYFARLYAQWKYKDADIVKCMYYNKQVNTGGLGQPGESFDMAWNNWLVGVRAGSTGGNYPAVAGYTAGLTFGVVIDNFDAETGTCDMVVNITSGTIGYSYFPAEMLIKKIQIPVSYTIYPAISVNPDGSVTPMLSNEDLFASCCWTDVNPQPALDCGGGIAVSDPTVDKLTTDKPQPTITGTYPNTQTLSLSITVAGQTFVNGSSSAVITSGNKWSLDLTQTSISLAPGFYDVAVSVVTSGGDTLTDNSVNEVYVKVVADTTAPTVPTVTAKTYSTMTPKILGTYPSADAAGGFSVSINGWTYTLGSKSVVDMTDSFNIRTVSVAPLSAVGDAWTLDMSKDTSNALGYQTHSVTARVTDAAGNSAIDATSSEIVIFNPTPITATFTTAGAHSVAVPAYYTKATIVAIGAGGGGGGGAGGGETVGSGGGAGGYLSVVLSIPAGSVINLSLGAGGAGTGAGVGAGTTAGAGGTTVVDAGAYGSWQCQGGGGGTSPHPGGYGGSGPSGSGGAGGEGNWRAGGAGANSVYSALYGGQTGGNGDNGGGSGSTPGYYGAGGGGGGGSQDDGWRTAGSRGGDGFVRIVFEVA